MAEEVKVMTRSEKRHAEKAAEWEETKKLSYDEMVKAKRGKAKRAVLGVVTVLTTGAAAFAAGKKAAVNEYKNALDAREVPDTCKEFTPADPTPQATFKPGPTWTTEATNNSDS